MASRAAEAALCAAYNDTGFVLVPSLLSPELLAELRDETDRLVENARHLKGPNDTYGKDEGQTLLLSL